MKYFVGYLLKGEVQAWHHNLAKEIAEKFGTWNMHDIPSHITVFRPFETSDIENVKNLLREWVRNTTVAGKFVISGFNRFDERMVFADVYADSLVVQQVLDLKAKLKQLPKMPEEDYPMWRPHATLANHLEPKQIMEIWGFVSMLTKQNFSVPFDNVTLFHSLGNHVWEVDEVFQMGEKIVS